MLGTNPFGKELANQFDGVKIGNKRVVLSFINSVEGAAGSHMLFITRSKNSDLSNILAFTKNKPILTVSDITGAAREGVHVSFTFEGVKLREDVNILAAREVGLIIGGDLLRDCNKVRSR